MSRGWLVICCAALGCLSGCGSSDKQAGGDHKQAQLDLKRIGLAYHNFCEKTPRGPKNLDELRPFIGDPAIEAKLADGTYVFNYGFGILDMNVHGTSKTILAYHKDVPTKGGPAVMGDGGLYLMKAGEYKDFPPPPKGK